MRNTSLGRVSVFMIAGLVSFAGSAWSQPLPRLTVKEIRSGSGRLNNFVNSQKFVATLNELATSSQLQEQAKSNPKDFLKGRGIKVPQGLDVTFEDMSAIPGRPAARARGFCIVICISTGEGHWTCYKICISTEPL